MFPAFICANNIGSLVNSLFGVNIFNHFPSFTSSSPLYSGSMSDKLSTSSSDGLSDRSSSSAFCLPNFTLSAIVSPGCDLLFYS